MFYYLDGMISYIGQNLAVVDINGAGYACSCTTNTLSYLETGKKAKLYTYCNIKEDAFDIYGFYTEQEKRSFEMLISVSGVGPKAALSILSFASPEQLAVAIIDENDKLLTAAPGIGKRTAQRIILELKDKIAKENITFSKDDSFVPVQSGVGKGSKINDASSALAVLGFGQAEISALLRGIDTESLTVEQIVKEALKNSMK